jgi:hypothetical protein
VLQEWGLLKYHVVGDPYYRGNALVLQTPHNTAVLVERATRVEWVVDLWPRGYLQPPDVMTLEKWVTEDCASRSNQRAVRQLKGAQERYPLLRGCNLFF